MQLSAWSLAVRGFPSIEEVTEEDDEAPASSPLVCKSKGRGRRLGGKKLFRIQEEELPRLPAQVPVF